MSGPVVTIPSSVTVSSLTVPIAGISITDAAAATNPGQMYLSVGCNNGTVGMSLSGVPVSGSPAQTIVMQPTFAQANAALASLTYSCASSVTSDTITIIVWDQYGLHNTFTFPLTIALTPTPTPTPAPTPTPSSFPGDSSGVQAFRIADFMECFGVNLYPMTAYPGTNFFGSSGNYTTSAIIKALGWLTADAAGTAFGSGLATLDRLWSYQGATGQINLQSMAAEIAQGCPNGVSFTVTGGGAPGAVDSIPYQVSMAEASHNGTSPLNGVAKGCIAFVEGYNEPNGIGGETVQQTVAGQQEYVASPVFNYTDVQVASPSVVFSVPYPENSLKSWLSSEQGSLASASNIYTVHFYPSGNVDFDDGSGRGGEFNDVHQGIDLGYGTNKNQIITEWHPTEYNNVSSQIYNSEYDAYYTPLYMLSAFRLGYLGYVWWAMLDFNSSFTGNGLWPTDPTTDTPRNAAYVIRAMYALTGDTGSTKRTFSPSKLNYTISGLPAPASGSPNSGGQSMLFQNSAGKFFLYLWNSQQNPGGSTDSVIVTFENTMANVVEYDLTSNPASNLTVVQSLNNTKSATVQLNAGVRLLVIDY